MHTRNHQPAPALCASVALVATSSTLANLAANAMFARALLDDHTGESPTMQTHHVLAGTDLPHHLVAAMLHQPGRHIVLVDSNFDHGAMTLSETDDPGRDLSAMLMTDLPRALDFGDLHHDQGVTILTIGGRLNDPGLGALMIDDMHHDLGRDATMLITGGRHKDPSLGAMKMFGDLHHHPDLDASALMVDTVHNDEGARDLDGGGGITCTQHGEHRMTGNHHPQTARRRLNQPQNRGRHHDTSDSDMPVMMCIGAFQHATTPAAHLLN